MEDGKKRNLQTKVLQEEVIENSVQQSPPQTRQDMCQDREGIGIKRDST